MTSRVPPKFENAPGLVCRPIKRGWVARWEARSDLTARGFAPATARLWSGVEPSDLDRVYVSDRCQALQAEMLVWGRGGIPEVGAFDGTLKGLIRCYQHDADSSYRKLRYHTRRHYDDRCRRLETEHGDMPLTEIKARTVLRWHEGWAEGGRVPMAHSMIGMLRTLFSFGLTILEDDECERLSTVLHKMKFSQGQPRSQIINADQVVALRAKAHEMGYPSIALAQAFQFELMLRQKDVIGEWVPLNEPGASDVFNGNDKWLRGIRWNEIDANLILRHTTSKRQKAIEPDLKLAPMVLEELAKLGELPSSGPLIVRETTGLPWYNYDFRRIWRKIANECGIPKLVKNMDSRAGAITEATDAGAELEHVRHAATHSDIAMTQRYSRAGNDKTAKVMQIRVGSRHKKQAG
jgi:hypothetical protein